MAKKILFLVVIFLLSFRMASAADECSYTVTKDIKYGEGTVQGKNGTTALVPLYLDAYIPTDCKNGSDKLPVPMGQVHGGGFMYGDKSSGAANKARFAKAGYAVFAINYRLLGKDKQPVIESLSEEEAEKFVDEFTEEGGDSEQTYGALVAVEDSIKAKEFVQKQFKGKIDTRWFIQGGSAGAYTAVNMAYLADYVFGKNEDPIGIIELSGGISNKKQYIEHGDSNVLIIHGTDDARVPYQMSDRLVTQATAAKVPHQRITVVGGGHGLSRDGLYDWKVNETGLTVFDHMILFMERSLSCKENKTSECQSSASLAELTTTPSKETSVKSQDKISVGPKEYVKQSFSTVFTRIKKYFSWK